MQDMTVQQGWVSGQKRPRAMVLWVPNRDHAGASGACQCSSPPAAAVCCVCAWSCLTLSPPGSGCTIHGISQARILEWPAMSFSFWSLGMHLNPRVRVWRIFCVLGNYCYLHISGPQRSKAGPSQGRYTLSSLGHFWGQNWWKRKDKIHMKSSRNGSLHCKNLWILCLGLVLL